MKNDRLEDLPTNRLRNNNFTSMKLIFENITKRFQSSIQFRNLLGVLQSHIRLIMSSNIIRIVINQLSDSDNYGIDNLGHFGHFIFKYFSTLRYTDMSLSRTLTVGPVQIHLNDPKNKKFDTNHDHFRYFLIKPISPPFNVGQGLRKVY